MIRAAQHAGLKVRACLLTPLMCTSESDTPLNTLIMSMQPMQRKFQKEFASHSTSNKTDIILTSQFNV